MTDTVPIATWEGGTLYDENGNRVGAYCKETGRGMFEHTFFVDERTCTVRRDHGDWCELSCGHDSGSYYDLHYCHVCGARVVKEEG